ncbi:MAG: protease modulator HflK [Limisphaerales bacterium]
MSEPRDPSPSEPTRDSAASGAPLPTESAALEMVEDAGSRALSEALQSSFVIVKILMIGFVIAFCFSGIFIVKPNEEAVILRFGRPVGQGAERRLKSGLHWALPYPVDEIVRVPVRESHTVASTAGWYPVSAEDEARGQEPPGHGSLTPVVDGYTLTSDGNIIHVRAALKYLITDPVTYAFNFTSITNLLQDYLDNAIFYASARYTADDALSRDKGGFRDLVQARVSQAVADHQFGIALEPIYVQTAAPLDVRQAFDQVLSAEQERSKKVNDAEGDAHQIRLKAQGEATALLNEANSSTNLLLQTAAADAKKFVELLPNYQKGEQLFKRQLYIETLQRVMTNAQEKFFVPRRADGKPRELRLLLGREPQKPKSQEPAQK